MKEKVTRLLHEALKEHPHLFLIDMDIAIVRVTVNCSKTLFWLLNELVDNATYFVSNFIH